MIQKPNSASATSIWAHLVEGAGPQDGSYPLDAGDFGRCEDFLFSHPMLIEDFGRMAEVNAYWAALVPEWESIASVRQAEARTAAIMAIIRPIQKTDPSHAVIGSGVFVRVGPITFKGCATTPQEKEHPMSKQGHNSGNVIDAYSVTADELRAFIERVEQLDAEKRDLAEQKKEVMAEAKGQGYDTKVMRKVIALRKRTPDDIAEEEAVLELYKSALGMQ
jgi:uncharacterized protein (UPF0335 family)